MLVLDLLTATAAIASAWFWWRASRHRLRRVSRLEDLDYGDINRLVVALSRSQILNSRAALTTAAAAVLATLRVILSAFVT